MPQRDTPPPSGAQSSRSVLMWLGILVVAAAATVIAPIVVALLDFSLVHKGRWMPDRGFAVTDASGASVGHGYRFWAQTSINVGHLQTGLSRLSGTPRPLPAWASGAAVLQQAPHPGASVATGMVAWGWPTRWYVSTKDIEYGVNYRAVSMKDGPSTILWFRWLCNVAFFVVALLIGGQLLEIARRIRGFLRRRKNRCASCGYDLAARSAPRCPECGVDSEPRSASVPTG